MAGCWQNLILLTQVHLITHQETSLLSSLAYNCGVYFLTLETPGPNSHNQNHKGPAVWRRSGVGEVVFRMMIISVSCDDYRIFFSQYSWSIYYIPGTMLRARLSVENKMNTVLVVFVPSCFQVALTCIIIIIQTFKIVRKDICHR